MKIICMMFAFCFSTVALSSECPEKSFYQGRIELRTGVSRIHGCFLAIRDSGDPLSPSLNYRQYYFYESGMFFVFVSTETDNEKDDRMATGARVYFFRPTGQLPDYSVTPEGQVIVQTAGRQQAVFSIETGTFLSLSHAEISISPEIALGNNGGVEISKFDGVLLDSGWRQGGMPTTLPAGITRVSDLTGPFCDLRNNEIFTYFGSGEFRLTHRSDSEFADFLAVRCPHP